jgi:hypothetical protein
MKLYLVTLSDGHQILARIAFPFPHSVRTGAAFAHRENDDRARIPARTQSEARLSSRPLLCSLCNRFSDY